MNLAKYLSTLLVVLMASDAPHCCFPKEQI